MDRFAFVLLAAVGSAGPIAAAPITLADYLVPGTTAVVGGTTYSNFTLLPPTVTNPFPSTPIDPSTVRVTPVPALAGGPALDFVFTANNVAGPFQSFELQVQYRITNPAITATRVALNGASASGDGAVTGVVEAVGANPVPPEIAFAVLGIVEPVAGSSFPAVSALTVQNGFVIDGGTDGNGRLVSARFSATAAITAADAVPEPGTFAVAGLLAAGGWAVCRRGAGRVGRAVVV